MRQSRPPGMQSAPPGGRGRGGQQTYQGRGGGAQGRGRGPPGRGGWGGQQAPRQKPMAQPPRSNQNFQNRPQNRQGHPQQNRPRGAPPAKRPGGDHPGGKLKEDRYKEGVSQAMKDAIEINNKDFYKGIHPVEIYSLIEPSGEISTWQKVQSLSKRYDYYYFNRDTHEKTPSPPDDVLNFQEDFLEMKAVAYSNPKRPKFDPAGHQVVDVQLNSFRIINFKEISGWTVFIYNVEFDPPISAKGNFQKRRQVFFGSSKKDFNERRRWLYENLGHWEFNNQVLVVLSNSEPPSPLSWKSGDTTVRLVKVSKGSLEDFDDDEVRSNFLSVFTRRKMDDADYVRLTRDGGTYFPRSHLGSKIRINSSQYVALVGFDAKVSYTNTNQAVMTVDARIKCIEEKNMNMNVDFIIRKNQDWQRIVKRTYEGKHVMVTYNKQSVRIDEVDCDSNHNTEIPDMNCTYKSYLKKRYNVNSPKNERCILINIDKRTGQRNGYLPQHCHIIFQNEDDRVQDQLKDLAKEKLQFRFPRLQEFVHDVNQSRPSTSKKKDWKGLPSYQFNTEFEYGKAVVLKQPGIRFKHGEKGQRPSIKSFDYIYDAEANRKIGSQWRYSKGPMKPKKISSWVVILLETCKGYKVNQRGRGSVTIEEHIKKEAEAYRRSRGLNNEHFPQPNFAYVNVGQGNVHKLLKYQKKVEKNELVLGILPPGEMQSQVKQEMTRAFSLQSSKRPRATQFCDITNFNTVPHFVKSVFDMLLMKKGNKMYELIPSLRNQTIFSPRNGDMWFIGIAVDVNPDGGHWPIACVTIITDPLAGSMDVVFPVCHFQAAKTRIVPYEVIREMVTNVVERAYKFTKKLPKQIIVFREGIGEGSFPELYSKEITGIKKSVTVDCNQMLNVDWKPSFVFLTCQKGILNRVSLTDRRNRINDPKEPLLVFQGPLSRKHWDFLLQVVCEKRGGARPVKYVILYENIGLKKRPENVIDLFNIIHASHYGFCTSVPFQNGAASIPSPVKYALHHAELLHESIRECDKRPGDLSAHKKLVNRAQVLDWPQSETQV